MITLYQFQFSHCCEKVRWALDYKGIPYRIINLLPGLHRWVTRKLAPASSLPLIVDQGTVIQDSTVIITYLDEKYPQHPLTPEDPQLLQEVMQWEDFFNNEIVASIRLWFYFHLLPDRQRALKYMLKDIAWPRKPVFSLIYPVVRNKMQTLMHINSVSAQQAQAQFMAALEELDAALAGRRFLVGDTFTRADLSGCALLCYMLAGDQANKEINDLLPEAVKMCFAQQTERPFYHWLHANYQQFRTYREDRQ